VDVRPCTAEDLIALQQLLPIHGNYGHEHRLRGQPQQRWLYLLAFNPAPVGGCLVHWGGPVDDGVRHQLPEAVEITNLHVTPTARGQGAGRALIAEAEQQARHRGRPTIGVAVGDDNSDLGASMTGSATPRVECGSGLSTTTSTKTA
jgi:GNAT superfamily N-acetyltransferase